MKPDNIPLIESDESKAKTKSAVAKSESDKRDDSTSQYEIKNDGQAGLTGEAVDKQDPAHGAR